MIKTQIFYINKKYVVSLVIDKEVQVIGSHKKATDAMKSVLHLTEEIKGMTIILDGMTAKKIGGWPVSEDFTVEVYKEI